MMNKNREAGGGKRRERSQENRNQPRFHFDPEVDQEACQAWDWLLGGGGRPDWQQFPGHVFPNERGSWLAQPQTRLICLGHDRAWYGAAWRQEMAHRLFRQNLLSTAQYFATAGILEEVSRQIEDLRLRFSHTNRGVKGQTQSWESDAEAESEPPLDAPIAASNTPRAAPPLDLQVWQGRVTARLDELAEAKSVALQSLLATPIPIPPPVSSNWGSLNFWKPLGVAAILEREKVALARYLAWLQAGAAG